MVAEAHVWVDVEKAIREWARDWVPSLDGRVFFAANDNTKTPQCVVQRISGPDDACLVQFDVWAPKKADAAGVAMELATALDALARYEFEGILLHGANPLNVRWLPDPESNAPRYIVEAIFTASATEASS